MTVGSVGSVGGDRRAALSAHVIDDLSERPQRCELRRLHFAKAGGALAHRREDLDPLDRVDPEIRLELHVTAEHFGRIARLFRHDREKKRFEIHRRRRGVNHGRVNDGRVDDGGVRDGGVDDGRMNHGDRRRSGDRVHDGRRMHHHRRGHRGHGVHHRLAGEHRAQPCERGLGRLQEREMAVGHRSLVRGVRIRGLALCFLVRLDPRDMDLGSRATCARIHVLRHRVLRHRAGRRDHGRAFDRRCGVHGEGRGSVHEGTRRIRRR